MSGDVVGFILHRRISQLVPLGISIGFKKKKEKKQLTIFPIFICFLIDSILLYHQLPKNHKKEEMAPRHTRGSSTTLSFFFFFFSFLSGAVEFDATRSTKSRGIYEAKNEVK
jgi:hypothetical protein